MSNQVSNPPGDSGHTPADDAAAGPPAADKISISRLPITGPDLFGRDEVVQRFDAAWAAPDTNVITLIAWGGVGKSALVNHWLRRMARDGYCGARKVYAWSFYRQGTGGEGVSADQFIDAALRWFGDPDPTAGTPWDKGERLARLVRRERTLLLLDGLEPLQFAPARGHKQGALREQSMQALLRELAAHNPGLCVVTSRLAVADLEDFEGATAVRIDLEQLSPQAGAAILARQGVRGTQAELEQASAEFGGHALALTLLGSYLKNVHAGDIARRSEVDILKEDEEGGGHATRVMASYERWFGDGPEISALRLLGLFDRPADRESLGALRAAPAIPGLTDHLQNLTDEDWRRTLTRLRAARLVADADPESPDTLDAHPLVRNYFKRQLKQEAPAAWREGNNRLYEHLKRAAVELPDTLEEMSLLYSAVAHGCEAGRYRDAFDEVYMPRILRGRQFYSRDMLGAISADLAAVSAFLDRTQAKPVAELREWQQAFVLGDAGSLLWVMGRLEEAIPLEEASLKARIAHENWRGACLAARLIGEQHLELGDIRRALARLEYSLELSNRVGDYGRVVGCISALAHAQHYAGRWGEAEDGFRKAEELQKNSQGGPLLYAGPGEDYCELLLDKGLYEEARLRASETLALSTQAKVVAHIALGNLLLGSAYLGESRHGGADALARAARYLESAVNGLRQAGRLNKLPAALIARAALYRATGDFERAQLDLNEALRIVKSSRMVLAEADCYLESARLSLARGDRQKARDNWLQAKRLVEQKEYFRRGADVQEIGAMLGGASGGEDEG